jgi:hypothetical protein
MTQLGGAPQVAVPMPDEHDMLGDGWVQIEDDALTVAIRPKD